MHITFNFLENKKNFWHWLLWKTSEWEQNNWDFIIPKKMIMIIWIKIKIQWNNRLKQIFMASCLGNKKISKKRQNWGKITPFVFQEKNWRLFQEEQFIQQWYSLCGSIRSWSKESKKFVRMVCEVRVRKQDSKMSWRRWLLLLYSGVLKWWCWQIKLKLNTYRLS